MCTGRRGPVRHDAHYSIRYKAIVSVPLCWQCARSGRWDEGHSLWRLVVHLNGNLDRSIRAHTIESRGYENVRRYTSRSIDCIEVEEIELSGECAR